MTSELFGGGLRAGVAAAVVAGLVAGSGSAAAAVSTASSDDPVEGYVERVYLDLLDRAVDPSGRTTWSAAVRAGAPRAQVAHQITGSTEFRSGLIRAAYQQYLGRDPDPQGLRTWLGAMHSGTTIQQLGAHIVTSAEYSAAATAAGLGWVQAVYGDVLGRSAGPQEVEFWEGLLRRGATRQGVALAILLSDEHLTRVLDAGYQELLGRGIDPTGRRSWVAAIQAGARYEQVLGGILASNEYWILGIPAGSIPLRGEGRVGDFGVNADADQVIAYLTEQLDEEPEQLPDEGDCGGARLWEWDGLVLVVQSTQAGQPIDPYVTGWAYFGPPTATTARLHTAEGLRVGDPENRIPEVYPDAEHVHTMPPVRYWVDDVVDYAYEIQAIDEGEGHVVGIVLSGHGCEE